ncbi:ABC transporter substrate-binding protein [Hippea maritima]|uniref:ABC transporter substrate-binding protein n=1 Tax=Hippea maritima TaxID=84405 RepID=UPI0002FB0B91|nr:ABC transporter substrate-binding protein [Hippea maritima]
MWILSLVLIGLFSLDGFCFDRVVILAPDAADIFIKLDLKDRVVGITRHVKGFDKAKKVGSHLRPNIEIIKALNPDLIVLKKKNEIDESMFSHVRFYYYNPQTLGGILTQVERIGVLFGKKQQAERLIDSLKSKLKFIGILKRKPRVVFEVMQMPYILAGNRSIVGDIIKTAGGINIIDKNRYFVRTSPEVVFLKKPDIYLYEVGPMNKNPTPPNKRILLKKLNMMVVKVDESKFLRSNTVSFDSAVYLYRIFRKWSEHVR